MDLDVDACYRAMVTRDVRFDGRLFVGVLTTGIYCRPICPARPPRRRNVRFYATAAAAREAGFRPCLRCRPEIAPDLAAWRGTFNTVSRGLALIEQGVLDEGGLDALAERLGVGSRHLRRLFRTHLGASPITVAQTRRVHLAKQLIQETRLPMTEVALASGFGSVRRFNETFRRLYGRAPRELRRGRGEDAAAQGGSLTVRLPYREPYPWPEMIGALAAQAVPGVERVEEGCYARTFRLQGVRGTVRVEPGPGALNATVSLSRLQVLPVVIARLRRVFDLASDPDIIDRHLGEDPLLKPLVARRPGLRIPGAWDDFELAVRVVLAQYLEPREVPVESARLAAAHGEPLVEAAGGALSRIFPEPTALARLGSGACCRGEPAAAGALQALAVAMAGDLVPPSSLEAARGRLEKIAGLNAESAQYIAERQWREPDAFPAADAALARVWYQLTGARVAAVSLAARAQAWRPWRAYAAEHLRAVQQVPDQAGPCRKRCKPSSTGTTGR